MERRSKQGSVEQRMSEGGQEDRSTVKPTLSLHFRAKDD